MGRLQQHACPLHRLVGLLLVLAALLGVQLVALVGLVAEPSLAAFAKTAPEAPPGESEKEGEVDTEFSNLLQQRTRPRGEFLPFAVRTPSLIHPPPTPPTTLPFWLPPTLPASGTAGAGVRIRC